MQVGRITFGSNTRGTAAEAAEWRRKAIANGQTVEAHACNCIGPQPGETKCPCRLRAESNQGRQMVRDGVVIDGVEYDLVPRRKAGA